MRKTMMKLRWAIGTLALVISLTASAQWQSPGDVTGFKASTDSELSVTAGTATVRLRFLSPGVVRVLLSTHAGTQLPVSVAVLHPNAAGVPADLREEPDRLLYSTEALSVEIRRRPLRIAFLNPAGDVLNRDDPEKGMAWSGEEVRVWKSMPGDEYYFGFGEKAGPMQRRGTHMTMWNTDIPAYGADTDPLYQSIPFFYGIRNGRAYGIFFDNTHWSSFDMGKESRDTYSFGAAGGMLDYYFFAGPRPEQVLTRFTELVGRMPLPPLWSLGYQQCRWSYPNEQRVREIARGFRDRKMPCDVLYLDIDYMDGYRIFTWNRTAFPDPTRMLADLRREGFHTAVIVDPGIKADTSYHAYRTGLAGNHFLKYPDGRTYIGKVWPGECAFPDFSSSATRTWWGENFRTLVDAGVRGWWNDMNEPSVFDVPTKTVELEVLHSDEGRGMTHAAAHNRYGMEMTRATYEGVRALLPTERPFVLTRASYAGGHRYSAAWTGDNVASWEHLDMAIAMCLNLSVSGQPFVGSDIGGFIGYPGGELFARWLQFGVFTPLMRAHSVINEKNKEPWEYGDEYTAINRETLNLRYRLLPYIYTVMADAAASGMPAMRPLLFAFPEDGNGIRNDNEFLFGNDLLVAPVTEPGATARSLYLPAGEWFDYWTNQRYQGARSVTVAAPVNTIPLFVRSGAVLPSRQVVQYTDQAPIDPLTFTVYPGGLQSDAQYYEDDGISFAYEKGTFFRRTVNQWNAEGSTTLTFSAVEGSYRPPQRDVLVRFVDVQKAPSAVEVDGKMLPSMEKSPATRGTPGWWYTPGERTVTVQLPETIQERRIRMHIN
jgi:alpha-glucosidase